MFCCVLIQFSLYWLNPFCYKALRVFCFGWGGRIWTYACGSQSPVPYRLATPHRCNEVLVAGVLGFEPRNVGVRVPCLTAWRHPKITFRLGWVRGFEPMTSRATIWRSTNWAIPTTLGLFNWFERTNGASGGIRTPDLCLRRALLYPAELQTHTFDFFLQVRIPAFLGWAYWWTSRGSNPGPPD